MAIKTSFHQQFHKKWHIYIEKGIFKENYLLPAWHHMNNFRHILYNPHLLYKYKKIVLKTPDQSYHGNRKNVLLDGKEILQKMRFALGEMWNWHFTDWLLWYKRIIVPLSIGPYTPIFLIPRPLLSSFWCDACSISAIVDCSGKSQLAKYFQNFYALEIYAR